MVQFKFTSALFFFLNANWAISGPNNHHFSLEKSNPCKHGYQTYKGEPKIIRNNNGKCHELETETFLADIPGIDMKRSVCCLPESSEYDSEGAAGFRVKRSSATSRNEEDFEKIQVYSSDLLYMAIGALIPQLILLCLTAFLWQMSKGKLTLDMPEDTNFKLKMAPRDNNDLHSEMVSG